MALGGDKNQMQLGPLIAGLPKTHQIVTKVTHGDKILDVLLTNLFRYYSTPIIVNPVQPDDPNHGVPSDHQVPVAYPVSQDYQLSRDYIIKTARHLPDSGLEQFDQWISSEEWRYLPVDASTSDQVEYLQSILEEKVNTIFPRKTFKIFPQDKPFITSELKTLDRLKKREYMKHGRSEKYLKLKDNFDLKYQKAASNHLEKNVMSLTESDPGEAYSTLTKMGTQPGDCQDDGSFTLTEHLEQNLTKEESTEKIAQHFAKISQNFPPLNIETLPENVKCKLNAPVNSLDIPKIKKEAVLKKLKTSKKPKSGVRGDLPHRIGKLFLTN